MSQIKCSKLDNVIMQARFNAKYMTTTEIMKLLNVSRVKVFRARQAGLLPGSIVVSGTKIVLWERLEIMPYIRKWKAMLNNSKGIKK